MGIAPTDRFPPASVSVNLPSVSARSFGRHPSRQGRRGRRHQQNVPSNWKRTYSTDAHTPCRKLPLDCTRLVQIIQDQTGLESSSY